MALAFHCPHCGQPLPVSPGMLGQVVECRGCQQRFTLTPAHLQAPSTAAPPAAPKPTAAPGPPAVATTALAPPVVAEPPRAATATPAAQRGTVAPKNVVAPPSTTLKPTPDGKLPSLNLEHEVATKEKGAGQSGPSTLVVVATLAVSVTLSLAMVLIDFEPQAKTVQPARAARYEIQQFYGEDGAALEPYQTLLRQAQRAHSRGDRAEERKCYRQVLELLRAEGRNALTGTSGDDTELEKLLATLLRDGG